MPTYEFRCPSGHEFERFFRKISDAASELPCPECGAAAGRQLSAGAGLLFKGSGFYLTDYGKNAHRKAGPGGGAKGEGGGTGGDSKAGEGKSGDTKPAAPAASEKKSPSQSKPSGGDKD
jgi:putative FmdB family regulatory protein